MRFVYQRSFAWLSCGLPELTYRAVDRIDNDDRFDRMLASLRPRSLANAVCLVGSLSDEPFLCGLTIYHR